MISGDAVAIKSRFVTALKDSTVIIARSMGG